MKTILVSGASGVVGYGILKSLRNASNGYRLIGSTIYNDSVAPAFCDIFELAPPTQDKNYLSWLSKIIKKHSVDMVVPGIEADMIEWNKHRDYIKAAGTYPLLNNPKLIDLCADKWNFYEKLASVGSRLAIESSIKGNFEKLKKDFGLPFLLKPRRGFGSKGIVIVDSEESFNIHKKNLGTVLMAQPIVGSNDEEYTISAFFDKQSKLLSLMSLRRKLAQEGFTEKAQVVNLTGAEEAIEELAKPFKPIGPTNFQFRVEGNQLKLLEINPRISSATAIRTIFGYNESKMSVEYFLDGNIPKQPKIKQGYAVRYVEEKVFYDSTNL
jgi:carbamoyl-phosphate synthase large subunit